MSGFLEDLTKGDLVRFAVGGYGRIEEVKRKKEHGTDVTQIVFDGDDGLYDFYTSSGGSAYGHLLDIVSYERMRA